MSPRRLSLTLGLATLTLAGVSAALPWTIGTEGAARLVGRELAAYGLSLHAEGPATLRLLPLPRLDFARTRIAEESAAAPLAEGGRLTIVLDPIGLMAGRIGIGSLTLDGTKLVLTDDARWAGPLRRLSEQVRAGWFVRPHRVVLKNAALAGPGHAEPEIRDLDLDLDWPAWGGSLDGRARFTWRGQRARANLTDLRPAALAEGTASPFAASLIWPGGSLSAEGDARLAAEPSRGLALEGTGKLETRSLPQTLAWIGRDAALAPLAETFALEGSFSAEGAAVMLPRLRVRLGQNVLDGAGQASLATPRAAVQATLAADSLNLAPLLGQLLRVLGLDGEERAAPALALHPFTGGDLDLRLSAAAARIGPVALEDMAASLLVRDGAVEIALNRAAVQGGTVKGRATLTSAGINGTETEVKAQGALDQVDLGGLLIDLGASRWVLGPSQGHFSFEGSGRDLADLAARTSGRAALTIDRGAIVGLDLADVIQRHGGVAAGALARRNGRTPFERASLSLRFADGVGEIAEGVLQASALSASLRGYVSLRDHSFRARAELHPRADSARPGPLFDLAGPWDAVTVRAARPGEAEPELPTSSAAPSAFHGVPGLILPGTARAYAP
ncbi:AsmA family protein [Methylobacterium dankookense]|uniref:AsmA domain-containing protein n=1 Tax=Methylobacterium dankookense TaxID=560405 RepID=A0A564FR13_9HYPH|nr:AsmA family protein [Methylobacterium dankookense]GJD55896.1 hypothetical protein IFDJLNFL_1787 [Methylobacterium dankookense]VUF10609.1 hypothetical protein MTDSW087_00277 [Methylobacterium dankookense]